MVCALCYLEVINDDLFGTFERHGVPGRRIRPRVAQEVVEQLRLPEDLRVPVLMLRGRGVEPPRGLRGWMMTGLRFWRRRILLCRRRRLVIALVDDGFRRNWRRIFIGKDRHGNG